MLKISRVIMCLSAGCVFFYFKLSSCLVHKGLHHIKLLLLKSNVESSILTVCVCVGGGDLKVCICVSHLHAANVYR